MLFLDGLASRKMISKGCIYHIIWVRDTDSKTTTLEFVPIINKFSEVFLDDLHVIPRKREIDFDIDLLPHTQTIYIHPYRMAPAELKELKDQVKDLLNKDFIRPSISPRSA